MSKIKEYNEELKEKIGLMKSQTKKLELGKTTEVQETTDRKWKKTLFTYKHHKEALNSQVEALTQENKEKENELIDMELINLKNVSMFNFEEIRRIIQVEIEKLMEKNK